MKKFNLLLLMMTILSISGCKLLDTPARDNDRVYRNSGYSKPGIFTSNERGMIRDYYGDYSRNKPKKAKKLPKGLQKKYERTGQLPPGWQKKMARGEVIPSDVYAYRRDIPYDLRRRLPIGPVGSKIIEIEGKIIRVMQNTREILDILDL